MEQPHVLKVETKRRIELVDISAEVAGLVADSGIAEGICVVFSPHTTAGLTINEAADPDVRRDIEAHLSSLVPREAGFRHAEGNSDAHLKTSLMGPSLSIIISGGALILGTWQGIYFCEFDGPRSRSCYVKCIEG
jgi:secondary thiamine-phosphate synthase enzyme